MKEKLVVVGAACIVLLMAGGGVVTSGREGIEPHRDIVCYSSEGIILLFAEDVRVELEPGRRALLVVWPNGKERTLLNGSCEWAPHGTVNLSP
jgi:hypothetical protein